jgi:hypothetical protein
VTTSGALVPGVVGGGGVPPPGGGGDPGGFVVVVALCELLHDIKARPSRATAPPRRMEFLVVKGVAS